MVAFPQEGGCVCGDNRYVLREDPVLVYACHCTDCQTETGSAFLLAVVVRSAAFEYTKGSPETWRVELPDGRVKGAYYCARCKTNLGGPSRFPNLASVDGGTFDDTSWLVPAGHIWTRSAQPWLRLPEDSLRFPAAPSQEELLSMVRAWKERTN
jgi:hypothetical protein